MAPARTLPVCSALDSACDHCATAVDFRTRPGTRMTAVGCVCGRHFSIWCTGSSCCSANSHSTTTSSDGRTARSRSTPPAPAHPDQGGRGRFVCSMPPLA